MSTSILNVTIAVIGGGPAGALAAELLASQGADTVVLDPRAPWEKPCGGGLTDATFRDIPQLAEVLPWAQEIHTVRVEAEAGSYHVPLARPIQIVSRSELGRWQLDRALAAGAVHLRERVRSVRRVGGAWRLETPERVVRATFLVGADGAASIVRRAVAPKFDVELAPTRVAFPDGAGPTPDTLRLRFFPAVAGYVWDFPRRDHRSIGIGLQAGGWQRPAMDASVDAFLRSAEPCRCGRSAPPRAGAVIGTAQRGHGDFSRIGGEDFALLGDAAGLADPTTGEGIRNALRSARLLAECWRQDGTFAAYPGRARQAFEREFSVSRILRRIAFEGEVGSRVVDAAVRPGVSRGLMSAVADALNEHDGNPLRFVRRWFAATRAGRVATDEAMASVPDVCTCGEGGQAESSCSGGHSPEPHSQAA